MLAVLLDRRRARFFEINDQFVTELPVLRSRATGGRRFHSDRADAPGAGERQFQHRRATEEHRHFERVAQRLATLTAHRPDVELILGGPGPTPVVFQRTLPPDLARRVIGVVHLDPVHAEPTAVRDAALAAAARHAGETEQALLEAALMRRPREMV